MNMRTMAVGGFILSPVSAYILVRLSEPFFKKINRRRAWIWTWLVLLCMEIAGSLMLWQIGLL